MPSGNTGNIVDVINKPYRFIEIVCAGQDEDGEGDVPERMSDELWQSTH